MKTVRMVGTMIGLAAAGAGLVGCAAIGIEAVQATKSEVIIANNIDDARAGDPEAQFEVGEAYCCSLNEGSGLYNTKTSVEWLCQSARQGYAPAMLKLGRIYSGDTIDGARLVRRVAAGVVGGSENFAVAAAWLRLARDGGESDAEGLLEEVGEAMSEAERAEADRFSAMGANAPCTWPEVFGS